MSQLFMVLIISCKSQQILKKNTCTGKTKYSYLHVESGVVCPQSHPIGVPLVRISRLQATAYRSDTRTGISSIYHYSELTSCICETSSCYIITALLLQSHFSHAEFTNFLMTLSIKHYFLAPAKTVSDVNHVDAFRNQFCILINLLIHFNLTQVPYLGHNNINLTSLVSNCSSHT